MHDIESHLEDPWIYYGISANLNLTENFISKPLSDNWNWISISEIANRNFNVIQRSLN